MDKFETEKWLHGCCSCRWWPRWCHQHHARVFPNYASWWMIPHSRTPCFRTHTHSPKSITITGAWRWAADVANSPARRPARVAPIFLAVSFPVQGWLPPPLPGKFRKCTPLPLEKPPCLCLCCSVWLVKLFDGPGLRGFPPIVSTVRSRSRSLNFCAGSCKSVFPPLMWVMCHKIFNSDVHKYKYLKCEHKYSFEVMAFSS